MDDSANGASQRPSIFTGSSFVANQRARLNGDNDETNEAAQFAAVPRWPFESDSSTSSSQSQSSDNSSMTATLRNPAQPPQHQQHQPWREQLQLSPTVRSPEFNRFSSSTVGSNLTSFGPIAGTQIQNSYSRPLSPPAARRSHGLGPPPSARRGPSSYYSMASYVSPIREEAESRTSKSSFGGQSILGTSFPVDEEVQSSSYELHGMTSQRDGSPESTLLRHGDVSKAIDVEEVTASRSSQQATTSTILDTPKNDGQKRIPLPLSAHSKPRTYQSNGFATLNPIPGGEPAYAFETSHLSSPSSTHETSALDLRNLIQANIAEAHGQNITEGYNRTVRPIGSQDTFVNAGTPVQNTYPDSPLLSDQDRVEQVLGGLQGAGFLNHNTVQQLREDPFDSYGHGYRDLATPLDERQNLPDLIMQATSLAAKVEQGSSAGHRPSPWDLGDLDPEKQPKLQRRRSTSSTRDILVAKPTMTSTSEKSTYDSKRPWPTIVNTSRIDFRLRPPRGAEGTMNKDRQRKCCGLPRLKFLITLAVFVICALIAVVVPISVLGLPGQKDVPPPQGNCVLPYRCENGGLSMSSSINGTCACVCANGFAGERCTTTADTSCVTTDVGQVQKATIGSQIAPLLVEAQSEYQIPLSGEKLLALFAGATFTCSTENALVVFQGPTGSKRSVMHQVQEKQLHKRQRRAFSTSSSSSSSMVPAASSVKNNAVSASSTTTVAIATVSSALKPSSISTPAVSQVSHSSSLSSIASPSVAVPATSSIGIPTVSSTTTSSSPLPTDLISGSNAPGVNTTSLTFAKIAVLFLLQESRDVDLAIAAQAQLQAYFTAASKTGVSVSQSANVDIGTGNWTVNLWDWHVTVGNGTVFGGRGTGRTKTNGTAAAVAGRGLVLDRLSA